MSLQTMNPAPNWEPDAREREAIETFATHGDRFSITVWGGDWCGDCQRELPPFAAALDSAGIDPTSVEQIAVVKRADGTKEGSKVEQYDIESIPTVVLERDGREIARFVESGDHPAIVELAPPLVAAARP